MSTETVKEYYGRILQTNKDLQTTACCTAESMPDYLKPIASKIHQEVQEKFYGCGSPIPFALDGCTVLDLGCGTGRDCFLLSKLVGDNGKVIGVDMTDQQLAVGRKHLDFHTKEFGLKKPNIRFEKGYIEDLKALDIADNSIDLVVSNCVINLSPDKNAVFREIFRVLKPGGELFFSDVFSNRRIPKHLATDPILLGECLGGAMYTQDFRRMLAALGVSDFRVLTTSPIAMTNPSVKSKVGAIEFTSQTIRAFKLQVEDRCEDYGQTARYLGGIKESPLAFRLDDHHLFETGKFMSVCSNTADMISKTRYSKYFEVVGDMKTHFGLFDCGPSPATSKGPSAPGACC